MARVIDRRTERGCVEITLEVHGESTGSVTRACARLARSPRLFVDVQADEEGSWGESWSEYSAEERNVDDRDSWLVHGFGDAFVRPPRTDHHLFVDGRGSEKGSWGESWSGYSAEERFTTAHVSWMVHDTVTRAQASHSSSHLRGCSRG